MSGSKTAADTVQSKVGLRLVDPTGKHIVGLKYQVRELEKIVAKGVTDAEGKLAPFVTAIGTILGVYVEKFDTKEMKLVRKVIPWSEDFTMKLASGKRKDKLVPQKDEGDPGTYQRKTYLVKEGDTLGRIAPRFGTTAAELAKLNGIALTSILHIDQVLKVPNGPDGKPAAPVAAPAAPAAAQEPAPVAPAAAPADIKEQQEAAPNDAGTDAEPGPAKVQPVTTPVPIVKEEDRGENGTPKTSLSPVCDQSGCIKLGDKGQLVEEINLRLMGFGNTIQNPAPLDEFTAATEKAVRQFQRDYMGVAETGKACGKVLAAIDDFRVKHPLPFDQMACQCRDHGADNQCCTGYGMARTGSNSVAHLKNGASISGVERPGMHRALFWSLRAAIFYLHEKESQLGCKFSYISSGYRCWKRAKQMSTFTFNHLGNACDVHFKRGSNGPNVSNSELENLKVKVFVDRMRANRGWSLPNRISLEPLAIAPSWIHMDVREFKAPYKLDRFYAKTREAADGDDMVTMAKREGRFGLINCGGIAAKPGAPVPVTGPAPVAAPAAPAPKPPAPAAAPKSPAPAAAPKPAANSNGATAGPASTERKDADTLSVSKLGLDFIRTWESGSLTKHHLKPYDDNKGFCTIGVGHLIDGKNSCAKLKADGSAAYKKYEPGIDEPQEDALFAKDVKRICNSTLPSIQVKLHQHEFDALMSLAFNTGGLSKFKKLLAKLNTGNYSACCDEFADITNGGDQGLVDRRKSEMKLFRNNVYDARH